MKKLFTFRYEYCIATIILFLIEVYIALYETWFVRHTVGDLLVVMLVYCFLRTFIKAKPVCIAIVTLLIAYFIECIQVLNVFPLLWLEDSTIAHIIMWSTFDSKDMIAYIVWVCIILVVDLYFTSKK